MLSPKWPASLKDARLLGTRISRLDGPAKTTGAAKYAFDINRPGMLYAKLVTSPHAHANVDAIDIAAAKALPGVAIVLTNKDWTPADAFSTEVQWEGAIVAAVAATTEEVAEEAAALVKVTYTVLPHKMVDEDPAMRDQEGDPNEKIVGDPAAAFAAAHKTSEGTYGAPFITHCCLESHGHVVEVKADETLCWPSTQSVSGYPGALAELVGIPPEQVKVDCQYMGGGFGSKFNPGEWGKICTLLSKETGKPVKLLLERDEELLIAGNRPSLYAKMKLAADAEGLVTALDADVWGSQSMRPFGASRFPYLFTTIPNSRVISKGMLTNRGGNQAWRAPWSPQSCLVTLSALDDMAAALEMDPLEFFSKNAQFTERPELYREQLQLAAELIGYKDKIHPRGAGGEGSMRRGVGMSLHTWGGGGHGSEAEVTIRPDASVTLTCGTQDLGTGTRTAVAIVTAETLGLPLEAVSVQIGRAPQYPVSGGSGGSTTIGGVSASSRLASTDALNNLFAKIAPLANIPLEKMEARDGQIREAGNPSNSLTWEKACSLLGTATVTGRGKYEGRSDEHQLSNNGVGGVQMADVSVDIETGIVTMNEFVAVQDCGLIVDMKTAESQVYGGVIMGITYALYEECVYDQLTGRMLNADMEFYRLAGLKDVGTIKVHMMTGPGHDERGVIGLGEPPVISPGAAISNAVANAIGVRVGTIPLTPQRVLAALGEKGGVA